MFFTSSFLDELRQKSSLFTEVNKFINLSRKGKEYIGCCPFHEEKTPSFFVNDAKGIFYCFGCGVKGNVFDFYILQKGFSFVESVEYISNILGVEIPKNTTKSSTNTKTISNLLEDACCWFESKLLDKEKGSFVRKYLNDRNILYDQQLKFRLGFFPYNDSVSDYLLQKGFTKDDIISSGLTLNSTKFSSSKNTFYEPLRGRLIFPIQNTYGNVVAFGGRVLGNYLPKYINTSESNYFHKRNILYGMNHNINFKNRDSDIIVVEGYLDVISLSEIGTQSVATLGTSLTTNQLRILWKYIDSPIICFDGDDAGIRAMTKCIDIALPVLEVGKSLRFAKLPTGQDPNSILSSNNFTKEYLLSIFKASRNLSDVLWEHLVNSSLKNGIYPETLASLKKSYLSSVGKIIDVDIRNFYIRIYSEYFNILYNSLKPKMVNGLMTQKNFSGDVCEPRLNKLYNRDDIRYKIFFACLINHNYILQGTIQQVMKVNFPNKWRNFFYCLIFFFRDHLDGFNINELKSYLILNGFKNILYDILSDATYLHGRFSMPKSKSDLAYKGYLELLNFFLKF
jgi:DNA primase